MKYTLINNPNSSHDYLIVLLDNNKECYILNYNKNVKSYLKFNILSKQHYIKYTLQVTARFLGLESINTDEMLTYEEFLILHGNT